MTKSGVQINDDASLESWIKTHDASQLDEIVGDKISEEKENSAGAISGTREGRPANGIVKLELSPEESFNLNMAYEGLSSTNAPYNGLDNNCTSFICNGLNKIGFNLKKEAIIDFYNIVTLDLVNYSFTPNHTYKQLINNLKSKIVKDAGTTTKESYEDAVLD